MSIDSGTKSVTYNAPINRGRKEEKKRKEKSLEHFFFSFTFPLPFSLPPARSDRAPGRARECIEGRREREDIRLLPRDGPCAQVPRREFDCCSSMLRSLGLFAYIAPTKTTTTSTSKQECSRAILGVDLDFVRVFSLLSPPPPLRSLSLSSVSSREVF